MKKNLIWLAVLLVFPLAIAGFLVFSADDSADPADRGLSNDAQEWGFERKTDHGQPLPNTKFTNGQFDAFYVAPDQADKTIYLTFDCGYELGCTPAILDALRAQGVKAMFFVTENYIKRNPELVTRMKEEGHLVGSHTSSHTALPDLSDDKIAAELAACEDAMREFTGYELDRFLRPPEGVYSERTLRTVEKLGYTTILWSIAYHDWDPDDQPSAEYVVAQFAENHHPGAITLMHNISRANAEALSQVIELLRGEGYAFGTLDQLTS